MNAHASNDQAAAPTVAIAPPPRVVIVVPMYNESATIPALAARIASTLQGCVASAIVIAVDDGSTDATVGTALAHFARIPGSLVVPLSRNFGKEAAILAGMDEALRHPFDALVLMDADLQHPPEVIPELLANWRAGNDIVTAARGDSTHAPAMSALLSHGFYTVFNRLADIQAEDGDGDFRLLSRNAVEAICRLRECDRFTKGLFSWIGFRQHRVYIEYDDRHAGRTKFSLSKRLALAVNGITSFSMKPLRIALFIGAVIAGVSVLFGIWIVIQTLWFGRSVPGYASVFVAVSFLGGVQLSTIGLLGEYIGRIYIQSKNRPPYIARAALNATPRTDHAPRA